MTKDERRLHFDECFNKWRKSGLCLKTWCKKNHVSYSALWYRKNKQSEVKKEPRQVIFSEILPNEEKSSISGVEVIMGSVTIRLQKQFDQPTLLSCIQLLGTEGR